MTKIMNETQYNWAVARVEQLLPLVKDDTPLTAPESIELQLLSNLVADYSEEHFSIGDVPVSTQKVVMPTTQSQHAYANA